MDMAAARSFYEQIFAGLPGSRIELLDTFGSRDRIGARFAQRGRHRATYWVCRRRGGTAS